MINKNPKIISEIKEQLWKLSGGDYIIIKACTANIQNSFMFMGLFVCLIFLVCLFSGLYSTFHFFYSAEYVIRTWLIAGVISIFFAWMVINIYLVLLATLSKNILPHIKNKRGVNVSVFVRITFVLFIAIIVSKPLECLLLENNAFIDESLEKHKLGLADKIINHDERLSAFDKAIIVKKINDNYFFSYRLSKINYLPQAWFVTLIVISLFFLPVIIINFFLLRTNAYYNKKGILEKNLILKEYSTFCDAYRYAFQNAIGSPIDFKPVCIVTEKRMNPNALIFGINKWKEVEICYPSKNPPFNTKPLIPNRQYKSQYDFINLIHGS